MVDYQTVVLVAVFGYCRYAENVSALRLNRVGLTLESRQPYVAIGTALRRKADDICLLWQ